jgi:hypothetical protein
MEATNNYTEILSKCTIGNKTSNFLSCIIQLYELSSKVYDALEEMYGEKNADEIIRGQYYQKSNELKSVLSEFLMDSIDESISWKGFDKI